MNRPRIICLMIALFIIGLFGCTDDSEKIIVTTYQPEEVEAHYAKIGGKITSIKAETELWDYGICWGETPNPDLSGNNYSRAWSDVPYHPAYTTPIDFDWMLAGLDPETEYHIRMFAAKDQNTIIYGEDRKFITKKE